MKKINVDLTFFNGDTKTVRLDSIAIAKEFIREYPKRLPKTTRFKMRCDAIAFEQYVSGTLETVGK